MEALFSKATTPLYKGCSISMLSTTLLLLNLTNVHGVTHTFMGELFSLLQKELLPKNNKMLISSYEAHKLIKSLSLTYDSIHAYANGCVVFWKKYKHNHVCPKCNTSRFVEGSRVVPRKVLRHFPLISWLIWMFRCNSLTKLMT
jgi:hypothetical protein